MKEECDAVFDSNCENYGSRKVWLETPPPRALITPADEPSLSPKEEQ